MWRPGVFIPTKGYQYEVIFKFELNNKRPKKSDFVLVKIKSYQIDGTLISDKESIIELAKLGKNRNTAKLQHGIRKMNIGDKYRFFIPIKIDSDQETYVRIERPLLKIYEVELINILEKDGFPKFPKETVRYRAVTQSDNFDTQSIFKIAKQKAEIRMQQRAMSGTIDWEAVDNLLYMLESF